MTEPASDGDGGSARAALRSCWELACVLNFFDTFGPILALEEEPTAEALEDALLEVGSTQPLLHALHRSLLQGMHPRTVIRSWRVTLAEKLHHAWPDLGEGPNPFATPAAEAEEAYDRLPAVQRVRALRALCELRLDARGDLRGCVDGEQEGARDAANFHGPPALGQDNRGQRYYYQDLESGPRLYRERSRVGAPVPRTLVYLRRRHDGTTARKEMQYVQPGPMLLEAWELVATTGEAVTALAEQLAADKFPGSRNARLCGQLHEVATAVAAKRKADELRRARQARQAAELNFGNILWCALAWQGRGVSSMRR